MISSLMRFERGDQPVNPYAGLPEHHYWRQAVSRVERHAFDPITSVKFTVDTSTRIATAGSCFAQHISRELERIGLNYFVTESGAEFPTSERTRRNYGLFSARYGNIYTARQLIQLLDEAIGNRQPTERPWTRPDGRFVDAFRPLVEPDGYANADAVSAARQKHLACVREMFERADVFVFTLGLTEAWRARQDGSVFPLAPGVSGGSYDGSLHEFINFTVPEVEADLQRFLETARIINPSLKVLLTVSPVPLIATYENRNVLVATTYSKSVLRVASETVAQKYSFVDYFPAYEIIAGSYNFGAYFEENARDVNPSGVAHAMRVFLRNYMSPEAQERLIGDRRQSAPEYKPNTAVVCDEESISKINNI